MQADRLTLEFDRRDRAVWLTIESCADRPELIWLPEGFGTEEVRAALLATGWVVAHDSELRLTGERRVGLGGFVEEMLGYFEQPNVPGKALIDVQAAAVRHGMLHGAAAAVSLYAFAWLDVVVREDVADEARSAKDLWNRTAVTVDVQRCCAARLEQLVARYKDSSTVSQRMAHSQPTRRTAGSRETKTG